MFDKDGGGSIDCEELKELMESVGQFLTNEQIKEMVDAADADGTGDIDFAEFAVLMAHKMGTEDDDSALEKAFAVFDTSGDGQIDGKEMRKIMINLGEEVTQEDLQAVMREVDLDGDGQINYAEFARVIATASKKDARQQGTVTKEFSEKSVPRKGLGGKALTALGEGAQLAHNKVSPAKASPTTKTVPFAAERLPMHSRTAMQDEK